ncbi:MAG: family protease, partial [Armatimonadetes bacterium]|nr:family protease [Armatimonadota bacterium]
YERALDSRNARPRDIIGSVDDRQRETNTRAYPYSAIAMLEITAGDGSRWVGTGWFVSPRTLITAGHCVFIRDFRPNGPGGWVQSIRVIPGCNGLNNEPFGSVVATRFQTVTGWKNAPQGDPEAEQFDYGAILLPANSPVTGVQVGTFGIGAFDDSDLHSSQLNLAGYPTDKPTHTLWYDVQGIRHATTRQVFYDLDTFRGQSGAPVYIALDNSRVAAAIHTYGTSSSSSSNAGTRITEDVFNVIQSWKT